MANYVGGAIIVIVNERFFLNPLNFSKIVCDEGFKPGAAVEMN
jgi:hypothetical protein